MDISKKIEVGIGIVGAGFMCRAHSNAYHKARYFYWNKKFLPKLVAVADITQSGANEAAERYGYSYGCVGWERLMADPEIDLVDICVGDALHARIALEAAEAGKAILCEKPLALTVEDARLMVETVQKKAVVNMAGYNYRFLPAVILAKKLITDGVMGKLYNFHAVYGQDQGADDRVPAEKLWYVMGPKASGASNGIGSHIIDMSRFLMGDIGSVSGLLATYNKTRASSNGVFDVKNDEEMLCLAEFKNGSTGLFKASAVSGGRKNYFAWEVYGSGGSMRFDTEDPNILHVYLRDSPIREINGFTAVNVTQLDKGHPLMEHFWPRGSGLGWEDAHVNEIAHLLDCIVEKTTVAPMGATIVDGLRVVETIQAIKVSHESGKRVFMEDIDGIS
jgi:predicted dehydrogenase